MLPRLVALLILVWVPAPARAEQCPGGSKGTLELQVSVPRIPTLQGGIGQTQVIQTLADPGKPPIAQTWPGVWSCFGYLADSGEFVLLHRDVLGATPAYVGLTFRQEATGAQRVLQFADLGHVVLAAPGGRLAVAVIGRGELVALDLPAGQAHTLGPAPAPPPFSAEEARFYKSRKPLAWDRDPRDGTSELEPEVLRFMSPTLLAVSYGKDTALRRARQRRVQFFDLDQTVSVPLAKERRPMPDLAK